MARFEVTPGQFGVLQVIAANPGLTQTALGKTIGIDRSTVVAVIDRLEERGLVVRAASPRDRRSRALRLSEAGERSLKRLKERVRGHERRTAAPLGPGERERLMELLKNLAG